MINKKTLSFIIGVGFSSAVFASALPHMNAKELAKHNGKNGQQSYVALNGFVYNVSDIPEWKNGKHYKGMVAGTDVTPYIKQSPHGAEIVHEEEITPVAIYDTK